METTTVRRLAVAMATAHGLVGWLLARWERPGRSARLRARTRPPPLAARAGYAALVIPLLYPLVVAIAPRFGHATQMSRRSRIDTPLRGLGLGLWVTGMSVLISAARTLGVYMAVDGVTEDHEMVTSGPYRLVRHPTYGSFTAVTAGLGLVFRSYRLASVAALWLAAATWWAAEEETLLASSEGFGEAYRTYREMTGRFLPRHGRTGDPT